MRGQLLFTALRNLLELRHGIQTHGVCSLLNQVGERLIDTFALKIARRKAINDCRDNDCREDTLGVGIYMQHRALAPQTENQMRYLSIRTRLSAARIKECLWRCIEIYMAFLLELVGYSIGSDLL
jgi:hypothetical protein